jgi:hypothetical protein
MVLALASGPALAQPQHDSIIYHAAGCSTQVLACPAAMAGGRVPRCMVR